jgi:transposase-like protein
MKKEKVTFCQVHGICPKDRHGCKQLTLASSPEYQQEMEGIMLCPNCHISMKTVSICPDVPEFAQYQCKKCKKVLAG